MNNTRIELTLRTEDEIPAASKKITDHYWNEGLPIFSLKRDEKWADLEKMRKYLQKSDYTRLIRKDKHGKTIIGQSMQGLALAWNYHPHAWNIKCANRRTWRPSAKRPVLKK